MITRRTVARSACVAAVLAVAGVSLFLATALRAQPRLKGRWLAQHDGLQYKVHFFQGQADGNGIVRGHFSERISNGYRGSGRYELHMTDERNGTIALEGHSLGRVAGDVHLAGRLELGGIVYRHQ